MAMRYFARRASSSGNPFRQIAHRNCPCSHRRVRASTELLGETVAPVVGRDVQQRSAALMPVGLDLDLPSWAYSDSCPCALPTSAALPEAVACMARHCPTRFSMLLQGVELASEQDAAGEALGDVQGSQPAWVVDALQVRMEDDSCYPVRRAPRPRLCSRRKFSSAASAHRHRCAQYSRRQLLEQREVLHELHFAHRYSRLSLQLHRHDCR